MKDNTTVIKYKYYILAIGNNHVSGVISDDNDTIVYHDLCVRPVFNQFTSCDEDVLIKYHESHERSEPKSTLIKSFVDVEITKEYWTAWEHASGRKRKAININDTTN